MFHYPKKDSEFKLATDLWLVALFGALRGINEWIDMFSLIQSPATRMPLKIIRSVTLSLSFACLPDI
ncbi:MAG: hypothetical protein AB1553_02840 [Nitrospirota bacterium]